MDKIFSRRWQVRTRDTRTGNELCTTEMPNLEGWGLPALGYRYESCMFLADGNSEVLDRYQTREQAEDGHQRLVLKRMWFLPEITEDPK